MCDMCRESGLEARKGWEVFSNKDCTHLRILMAFLRRLYPRNLPRHSGGASDSRAFRY